MKIQFLKDSPDFTQAYCIFISNFTPKEKDNIMNTVRSHKATVIHGPGLITIFCKENLTFNWLLLQWR